MNKKIIGSLAVAVFIFVLLVVSKIIPLKTVTEDFGTETFSLDSNGPITTSTTLVVKKGWEVLGNFSGTCENYQGEDASAWAGDELSFYILEPPPRAAVVFRSVGALSGVFNFTAEEGGGYEVLMSNTEAYFEIIITLTLEANQTGKIPLW